MEQIQNIIKTMGLTLEVRSAESFRAEEDGRAYSVWKLQTDRGELVLKKTNPMECSVYETFFRDGGPVPRVPQQAVFVFVATKTLLATREPNGNGYSIL